MSRSHFLRDELLGPSVWRSLVAHFGGGEYNVPTAIDTANGQRLVLLLGYAAAVKLIEYAGGTKIYVHAGRSEALLARYSEIRTMRSRGMTVKEIAAYEWPQRYTERMITEIITRAGDAPPETFPPSNSAPQDA